MNEQRREYGKVYETKLEAEVFAQDGKIVVKFPRMIDTLAYPPAIMRKFAEVLLSTIDAETSTEPGLPVPSE